MTEKSDKCHELCNRLSNNNCTCTDQVCSTIFSMLHRTDWDVDLAEYSELERQANSQQHLDE